MRYSSSLERPRRAGNGHLVTFGHFLLCPLPRWAGQRGGLARVQAARTRRLGNSKEKNKTRYEEAAGFK